MMLFIVAVSAARVSVDVSPVEKVITLLGDLRTQVQTEGAAEAATYDEFACFCRDTTDEKVTSINTKDDEVEQHVADVTQLSATRGELQAQIAELNTDFDTLSADLANIFEERCTLDRSCRAARRPCLFFCLRPESCDVSRVLLTRGRAQAKA